MKTASALWLAVLGLGAHGCSALFGDTFEGRALECGEGTERPCETQARSKDGGRAFDSGHEGGRSGSDGAGSAQPGGRTSSGGAAGHLTASGGFEAGSPMGGRGSDVVEAGTPATGAGGGTEAGAGASPSTDGASGTKDAGAGGRDADAGFDSSSSVVDVAGRVVRVDSFCSGTLLSRNWVLTTRPCASDYYTFAPHEMVVRHDATMTSRTVLASDVRLHPDLTVDIALLAISPPIEVASEKVPVFSGRDSEITGKTATVYRYGWDSSVFCNGTSCAAGVCDPGSRRCFAEVSALLTFEAPILGIVAGADMYNTWSFAAKYLIVPPEYALDEGGDRGGPLFVNGTLVGITGGHPWRCYARAFRDWVMGYVSPTSITTLQKDQVAGPIPGLPLVADVDGDGRTDLVIMSTPSPDAGTERDVRVSRALATGGFASPERWGGVSGKAGDVTTVGDFDGNRKDDLVTFTSTGAVTVALSDGAAFGNASVWHPSFGSTATNYAVGDVDGDSKDDILRLDGDGSVWVSMSCGGTGPQAPSCVTTNSFGQPARWLGALGEPGSLPAVGDFDGDGFDDVLSYGADGQTRVGLTRRHACSVDADCGIGGCNKWVGVCGAGRGESPLETPVWVHASVGGVPLVLDANRDGLEDLVLHFNRPGSTREGVVEVYLSDGVGFGAPIVWGRAFGRIGDAILAGSANSDERSSLLLFTTPSGPDSGHVFLGTNGLP